MRSTTVKGFALGMTFGALMVAGAATAKAEPPDQATIAYASHFAGAGPTQTPGATGSGISN